MAMGHVPAGRVKWMQIKRRPPLEPAPVQASFFRSAWAPSGHRLDRNALAAGDELDEPAVPYELDEPAVPFAMGFSTVVSSGSRRESSAR